jgi:hypothetical protein
MKSENFFLRELDTICPKRVICPSGHFAASCPINFFLLGKANHQTAILVAAYRACDLTREDIEC